MQPPDRGVRGAGVPRAGLAHGQPVVELLAFLVDLAADLGPGILEAGDDPHGHGVGQPGRQVVALLVVPADPEFETLDGAGGFAAGGESDGAASAGGGRGHRPSGSAGTARPSAPTTRARGRLHAAAAAGPATVVRTRPAAAASGCAGDQRLLRPDVHLAVAQGHAPGAVVGAVRRGLVDRWIADRPGSFGQQAGADRRSEDERLTARDDDVTAVAVQCVAAFDDQVVAAVVPGISSPQTTPDPCRYRLCNWFLPMT